MEAEAHDYIYFVHGRGRRGHRRADVYEKSRGGNSENGCVTCGRHGNRKSIEHRAGKFERDDAADGADLSSLARGFEFAAAQYAILRFVGSRGVSERGRAVIFLHSNAVLLPRSASQSDGHVRKSNS